ncbi:MAG: DUF2267 domain-containing protein [Pseudolabrys sp.]|jgi:uncharacterized protein (DUF2267 family)
MTQPRDVLYASKLFQEWLTALKERALLATHNQCQAMFHGVLLCMRGHMTTEQVLAFADALPPLPRWIFFERWRPAEPTAVTSAEHFLHEVVAALALHHIPPDTIVSDVFAVLAERSEPLAAKTMRAQLPAPLRPLWP